MSSIWMHMGLGQTDLGPTASEVLKKMNGHNVSTLIGRSLGTVSS